MSKISLTARVKSGKTSKPSNVFLIGKTRHSLTRAIHINGASIGANYPHQTHSIVQPHQGLVIDFPHDYPRGDATSTTKSGITSAYPVILASQVSSHRRSRLCRAHGRCPGLAPAGPQRLNP